MGAIKMHYYLEMTENAAEELFTTYLAARGGFGDNALQVGFNKRLNNTEQLEWYEKETKIYDFTQRILAGSILQLAKQGLSTEFGESKNFPKEPKIEGIPVAKIILQGRNQSMHYEEEEYGTGVTKCFQKLEQIDSKFSLQTSPGKNMSKEILEILGWFDYEDYLTTMKDLLGN